MLRRVLFFVLLASCLILLARVGDQYAWRMDLTGRQTHSLSPGASRALDALPAPLEITAYLPELAVQRAQTEQLLAPYLAHAADVRLRFVDPVRQPAETRAAGVARHGELHLRAGPRREVVTTASNATIDAALNRLARRGERWIVGFSGHGEMPVDDSPSGLGRFTAHVETLGYRVITLDPRQLDTLPDNTAMLLIAAPAEPYGDHVKDLIARFVSSGGDVLWLSTDTPPRLPDVGIDIGLLPGRIVDAAAARYGLDRPDNAIVADYPAPLTNAPDGFSVMKQARGLLWRDSEHWRVAGRLLSSPRSWNETGALTGQVARDPELGEQAGPITTGLILESRDDDGRPPSRLVVIGGGQFLGNDQIGQGANLQLAGALLNWLGGNEGLGAQTAARDLDIRWSPLLGSLLAIGLMAVLPLAYLGAGLWLRARRRRA